MNVVTLIIQQSIYIGASLVPERLTGLKGSTGDAPSRMGRSRGAAAGREGVVVTRSEELTMGCHVWRLKCTQVRYASVQLRAKVLPNMRSVIAS